MKRNKMKIIRSNTIAAIVVLASGGLFSSAALANISNTALPANGSVTAGQATISTSGSTESINENGNTVIDWKGGFDVGGQATVNFSNAGSGNATVLNVDNSGNPSEIAGTINGSNTNIIIANTNGVLVDDGATINDPGNTVGLIGGNASENGETGDIGFGVDPYQVLNAPVTISNGSTINAGDLIVAGEGSVNMGNATYNVTKQTDILGSQNSLDPATIGFNNGAFSGVAAPVGGLNDLAVPTTINIASGANIPMVKDIITAGYADGQSNVTLDGNISSQDNGQGITFQGDSFQGGGMVTTNNLHLSELYGNVNNPNGGGIASQGWVQNHLNIQPQASNTTKPVNVYFGTFQNHGPQYFNLWVNGNVSYNISEPTLNASFAGSHATLQSSGFMIIQANPWSYNPSTGQGPAMFGGVTNDASDPIVSFPGLFIAVSGINGNGTLNPNAYQNNTTNPSPAYALGIINGLDNAYSANEAGGQGIFLESPAIYSGVGLAINGQPSATSSGYNTSNVAYGDIDIDVAENEWLNTSDGFTDTVVRNMPNPMQVSSSGAVALPSDDWHDARSFVPAS
jgi:filamentous hemagglutinin family protein